MAWNDPKNKNQNGQDPWGSKDNGPPDLDEALKQLQRKIAGLFGGGKGKVFEGEGYANKGGFGFWMIAVILLAAYVLSGIYIVQQYEVAVVKRFGKYERTEGPGPHWVPRFVETTKIINVDEVKTSKHEGQMLTKDENIVHAEIAVQYRIANAKDYMFNLVDPDITLRQAADSALRGEVGQSTLNEVLTSGRAEVTQRIRKQIETILKNYNSGLEVSDLLLQQTKAPDKVKDAFDDAIKAQQDEERFVNEAQAYANRQIPIAEGHATRILQEADAYKQQQILIAKGSTARFEKLLPEYKRQPQILRDRLYMDTLEAVMANTNKILVDVKDGNNLMMLPLDKMMQPKTTQEEASTSKNNTNIQSFQDAEALKPMASTSGARPSLDRPSYETMNRYPAGRGE